MRRQTRLPISHPHHRPVTTLVGQELEHVGGPYLERVLRDDREGRLQIERDRAQRVRPSAPGHELQIAIQQARQRFGSAGFEASLIGDRA